MDPVQPSPKRGTRTLTSQNMTAVFVKDTQDIERIDAQGDGKFNENDRNGVAANVSYVAADETVRFARRRSNCLGFARPNESSRAGF